MSIYFSDLYDLMYNGLNFYHPWKQWEHLTFNNDEDKLATCKDTGDDVSDIIHSYIKDGYKIDSKESVIDREKDKDCTFKAVLKKDVDGIECKTVITLSDNGDDKNKSCTYHKVDMIGNEKWNEVTSSFNYKSDNVKDVNNDNQTSQTRFEHLDDVIKVNNKTKKVRRWKCTTPSAYKHNTCDCKCKEDKKDSAKANEIDDLVNKIRSNIDSSICSSCPTKSSTSDEVEDSLVTMVRRIFGL